MSELARKTQNSKSWREAIQRLKHNVKFNAPADAENIRDIETSLRTNVPLDLRDLLLETNGIEDWLLSAKNIIDVNLEYRNRKEYQEVYMPLDGLLFFLQDGTGSYYGYPICGGRCDTVPRVFYWLHETDERTVAGDTLAAVLERYLR